MAVRARKRLLKPCASITASLVTRFWMTTTLMPWLLHSCGYIRVMRFGLYRTVKAEESVLNGLDLFSGIGGIALAMAPWVKPVAYCEIDRYAQGVLVSRQADGILPIAGIWDDVRTLRGDMFPVPIDIITG